MRPRAGAIIGGMIGNGIEAAGTNGTIIFTMSRLRCHSISGITQGKAILNKRSGNMSFIRKIIVTSRVIPLCGNASRRRQSKSGRSSPGKSANLKSEVQGRKKSGVLQRISRMIRPLRAHLLHTGGTQENRGQPRSHHNRNARQFNITGSNPSRTQPGVSNRYNAHRTGKQDSKMEMENAHHSAGIGKKKIAAGTGEYVMGKSHPAAKA